MSPDSGLHTVLQIDWSVVCSGCEILLKLCGIFGLGFIQKQATLRIVMNRKQLGSNTSQVVSMKSEEGE